MVCLILATAGTAAMSAGGRLYNSVMYSLVARYAVPAIYGWVALMILLSPSWIKWIRQHRTGALTICLVLLLTVIPMQSKAWFPNLNKQFGTSIAGLTLTLQVHDPLPLRTIYFRDKEEYPPSRVLGIAKKSMEHELSIFSRDPYKTVIAEWGQQIEPVGPLAPETRGDGRDDQQRHDQNHAHHLEPDHRDGERQPHHRQIDRAQVDPLPRRMFGVEGGKHHGTAQQHHQRQQ